MTTKRIKTETYSLPSHWASTLINADNSGLSDQDEKELNTWFESKKPGFCVGCSEDSYFGRFNGLGGDLLDFYFHKPKQLRTIDKIISEVNTKYGAPMGRPNIGSQPVTITSGRNCRIVKSNQTKVFDCAVPMSNDGAYDRGGAYWGIGRQLRVRYTKDLSYIEFYRA